MSAAQVRELVKGMGPDVAQAHVLVFSKSWCPYCTKVKGLFNGVKPESYSVVELDNIKNGDAIHAELKKITGQSSVPNVFIGDKHIGGCDDSFALKSSGKLEALVKKP
eukprot:TRINITY_DN115_c2_g1_i1.p2 TRINITY_DN115_c2_g1~~TRINITY_DN115_c2_g1_i1.p2  ORF type:complete len:108 (+),score=25.58 TRINITY_DN115_c2_g1_i1:64-387(+)